MIARDCRFPIGGAATLREKDHRGGLGILLGIECIVERTEHPRVISDVDLKAANIDIGKATQHDRQDSRDGITFVIVKGSAASSVDGPRPGSTAGSTRATALDASDGGKDPGRYVPIPFGLRSRDIAGYVG